MSVDPEQDPTTEAQDALDPHTEDSGATDELGDAGKSQGSRFIDPISHF